MFRAEEVLCRAVQSAARHQIDRRNAVPIIPRRTEQPGSNTPKRPSGSVNSHTCLPSRSSYRPKRLAHAPTGWNPLHWVSLDSTELFDPGFHLSITSRRFRLLLFLRTGTTLDVCDGVSSQPPTRRALNANAIAPDLVCDPAVWVRGLTGPLGIYLCTASAMEQEDVFAEEAQECTVVSQSRFEEDKKSNVRSQVSEDHDSENESSPLMGDRRPIPARALDSRARESYHRAINEPWTGAHQAGPLPWYRRPSVGVINFKTTAC